MENPRQIAVQVLKRYEKQAEYAETLLEEALAKAPLAPNDRGLVQELTFGTIRWKSALDWLIARKTDNREQKPSLQILLRLGLYQILWLDRIPDHAAVHETVEMAKQLGFGPQSGFINAILRHYTKTKSETREQLAQLRKTEPETGFSHPKWLCDRWRARYGAQPLQELLAWNNTPPTTFARINTLRTTPEELMAQWTTEQVDFLPLSHPWIPGHFAFELLSHPSLRSLPSFEQGKFYIQDPSTLLAPKILDPQPGEAILDFCAAPGGKTTHIAQLMQNKGYIMAQDLDIRRRQLIRENCDRLGIEIVQISRATTTINDELSEPFDRILVDAPCTNSGVFRRRIDLRYRLQPSELNRLPPIQTELLHRASSQLKEGGILVYSTCSLEPEENRAVIDSFLNSQPGFELETETQLLPFQDRTDGAYVARLKKAGPSPGTQP